MCSDLRDEVRKKTTDWMKLKKRQDYSAGRSVVVRGQGLTAERHGALFGLMQVSWIMVLVVVV